MTATLGLTSPFAGMSIDKFGVKIPNTIGHLFHAIGCFLLLSFATIHSLPFIWLSLFFCGMGIGILFPTTTSTVLKITDKAHQGIATGLFLTLGVIGGSLGIGISCFQLDITSQHFLTTWLQSNTISLTLEQKDMLYKMASGSISSTHFPALANITAQAFYHGVFYIALTCGVLSFIAAVLSCFLHETKPKTI